LADQKPDVDYTRATAELVQAMARLRTIQQFRNNK
jgi:F-type H+-transporting ATPase subunit epsilon